MAKYLSIILVILLLSCSAEKPSSGNALTSKIKGGFIPAAGSWPSVGQLLYNNQSLCSSTLIAPDLLLTAGHCLSGFDTAKISVRFKDSGLQISAKEVYVDHRLDDSTFADYDVAIVKLSKKVDIKPIPLISASEWEEYVHNDMPVSLIGYGMTEDSDPDGNYRQVDVTLYDITETKFKTGNSEKLALGGDSGGPAIIQLPDGSYRQVGIAHKEMYGGYNLYSRVSLIDDVLTHLDEYQMQRDYLRQLHFPLMVANDIKGNLEAATSDGEVIISGNALFYFYPPRIRIILDGYYSIYAYLNNIFDEIREDQFIFPTKGRTFDADIFMNAGDAEYLRLDQTAFRGAELVGDDMSAILIYQGKLEYDGQGNYKLYDRKERSNFRLEWSDSKKKQMTE